MDQIRDRYGKHAAHRGTWPLQHGDNSAGEF
jgi:hypothetical protein